MDITFSDEQDALRLSARAWIEDHLPAYVGEEITESEGEWGQRNLDWEKALFKAGFTGMNWPKIYGGQGLGIVEHLVVMEELGRAMAPEGINNIGRDLVGPILLSTGTEDQKERFLERILMAQDVWCQGFSEPNAGSDLASVKTRATRQNEDWKIQGQKVWTSYAQYADWCILLARTSSAKKKHDGLTLFLVPMDVDGISVRPIRQINGKHGFNEVFFDDVVLADSYRLGPVDEGWQVTNRVLSFERGTTRLYRQARFASELQCLAELAEHPQQHAETFGRLHSRLEILRHQNLRIVSLVSANKPIGPEANFQKLAWSNLHQDLMTFADQVLGTSVLCDPKMALFRDGYLLSRAETIYAGSSEIQRSIIAGSILNLPRRRSEMNS
ncbi:MAG: acyl-CoA dehydrogenase family protein [Alphaproteobacteria bacterium]|nr:acyl-CoA dehydrogenase family protein [Alphaproteobacteria bacterium]